MEGKGGVVIVVEPLDLGLRLKDLEAFFLVFVSFDGNFRQVDDSKI